MEFIDTPNVRNDVAIQDLLEAGLHFGHRTKRWNPKMRPYLFGQRNGIYIIDLEKTLAGLQQARQIVYNVVSSGKQILFVGTKKQAQKAVKAMAEAAGQPYVVNRWLGGTLTNRVTIAKSIDKMHTIESMVADGSIDSLPKKEAYRMRHDLERLQYNLSGIAGLNGNPGALFVIDVLAESIAVEEARRLHIPVIAMVDANADPTCVDYPIPANDDAIRGIKLVCDLLACTIAEAQKAYEKVAAAEAKRVAEERAAAEAKAKAERAEREAAAAKRAEAAAIAKAERDAKAKAEAAAIAKGLAEAAKAKEAAEAPKADA
jgi:small subunit ribosomal protein S2